MTPTAESEPTLLQLVEDGKVSLDETIGTYVSGMPDGDTATRRELANMTGGIPRTPRRTRS